jgi:hypothetical protein
MDRIETTMQGVTIRVPSILVNGRTVIAVGRWLKIAEVKDEQWQEGEVVSDADGFIANVRQHKDFADIFTFSQKPGDPIPRFPFYYEWDSVAAIPVASFSDWWNNRVSVKLRQDVKRATRFGVVARSVPFTDELVQGIVDIFDESPVRQGRPFWHYRKGFEAVKVALATYLERSEFVGAFLGDELIGYLKIVYVDNLARLMGITSKIFHQDKRPTNALVAKAVELCAARRCSHLTYGKYHYTKGISDSSLTAFKHKNGFEELLIPKYYIPLTRKGSLALRLKLHHGAKELLPEPILRSLIRIRTSIYRTPRVSDRPSRPIKDQADSFE